MPQPVASFLSAKIGRPCRYCGKPVLAGTGHSKIQNRPVVLSRQDGAVGRHLMNAGPKIFFEVLMIGVLGWHNFIGP